MVRKNRISDDQRLFDFDEPTPEEEVAQLEREIAAAKAKLAPSKYSWNWWDAWPEELSVRDQHILQIKRDMRALEESEFDDDRLFFSNRIEAYRQSLRSMT